MALEEDDLQLPTRSGTFMMGVNNSAVEFSDIKLRIIPVPKGNSRPSAASSGSPGSSSHSAPGMDDSDEEFEGEDTSAGNSLDETGSGALFNHTSTCTTKLTCVDRQTWCTTAFGTNAPSDCIENFTDLCCS